VASPAKQSRAGTPAGREATRQVITVFVFLALASVAGGIVAVAKHRQTVVAAARLTSLNGVSCDANEYDFGIIPPSAAAHAQHVFIITNHTAHIVRITCSKSTCGCTIAIYGDGVLLPGVPVRVMVEAKWPGRSGAQLARVLLATDDSVTRQIVIGIRGNVLNQVTVSPAVVDFQTLPLGLSAERILDLGGPGDLSLFRITAVNVSNPDITIERIPSRDAAAMLEGPRGRFRVTVSAQPGHAEAGGVIVFDTNVSRMFHTWRSASLLTLSQLLPRRLSSGPNLMMS